MHSCKLITNLHAQKVLCHRAKVGFLVCNYRLRFLQCDWRMENSPQKIQPQKRKTNFKLVPCTSF